jgi:subtilisin family serine protease
MTLAGCLLASACQTPVAPPADDAAAAIAQELVVGYRPGASNADQSALRARFGVSSPLALRPLTEVWPLRSADEAVRVARMLAGQPGIEYAEPNAPRRLQTFGFKAGAPTPTPVAETPAPRDTAPSVSTPAPVAASAPTRVVASGDPDYDKQWYLGQSRFPDVWGASTGAGVTVAVIDSGVDTSHPDLKANMLPMIDEVAARGKGDTSYGVNFTGRDGNGHGTHVAGLIAATANNGIGIRGAAPGVKVLPIKVTSALGETDDVTIAKGIFDAVDKGAQVINLSIGGPDPSALLLEALNYAFDHRVTVVIAAGNETREVNYPAAFDGVVAVGALTSDTKVASYSNRGSKLVLCAPGGGKAGGWEGPAIYSTTPTYPCFITQTEGNSMQYGYLAGTSMATPLVTAAVALMLSREPGLEPAQVRTRLAASADDLETPGYDETSGYGALDAKRAFDYGRRP